MAKKQWFEVDKDGLKELQDGKPKSFILRELIANALDENVSLVMVSHQYEKGNALFNITDNSEHGFKDMKDAYTLYGSCYKRPFADKRGRFNLGEKEAFSVCTRAQIETTKGTITFDKTGRHTSRSKRETGTSVDVWVRMKREEYDDAVKFLDLLIPPDNIKMVEFTPQNGNGRTLIMRQPDHKFNANLPTVALINGAMRSTHRDTEIRLYKPSGRNAWLYEMGMPVCEIDCDYDINVSQRVPFGADRESVSEAYMKHLYAEVLNVVHKEIPEDRASEVWVRVGSSDERASKEAVQDIITKRYGDKVAVYTPNNPIANDEAVAQGYRLVHGSELSEDEWANVKGFGLINSTQSLFNVDFVGATNVQPTESMKQVETLVKRIARDVMGVQVSVRFVESKQATVLAQYGNRTLTFNVSKLGSAFFNLHENFIQVMKLILHELAHEYGHHTEMAYHDGLCRMSASIMDMMKSNAHYLDV
jgi:hypothetical protein